MSEIIRLGSRKPVSTYGKFLIVRTISSYTFWDTENDREISPPYLDENTPWEEIKIYEEVVVLTAFPKRLSVDKVKPTSGYTCGLKCVFLKSTGEFLLNPDSCTNVDVLFDDVTIDGGIIICKVTSYDKTTTAYWFDFAGTYLISKSYKQGDTFYTVKLQNGEKIKNVCEVQPIQDIESYAITGLHIICLAKDETEVNLFYPF